MNQHAENMKNALIGYKDLRDKANAQIKSITDTYGKEAGEAETRIQNKKLESARAAAVDTITKAGSAGYKEAEAWGRMDGSKLTDDVKLLDNDLVDSTEFDRLKDKYKDNATMLAVLKKYGERQNNSSVKKAGSFEVRDILTGEDKMKKWEKAQAQALDLLDAMDGNGKYANPDDWGAAFNVAAMPETLEHFGENL